MVKRWEEESIAIQRQKARCIRRRLWRRRVYGCLGLCVSAYAALLGWWLNSSGELDRIASAFDARLERLVLSSGLTVQHVSLKGQQQLSPEDVLKQAAIESGQFMLTLSLDEVQNRLLAHPQIASASLSRELPDRLAITITERQPAAIWQHTGKTLWLDKEGVQLSGALLSTDPAKDYLVVTGKEANEALPALWALIESAPALQDKIQAASWVGKRRWNLWLEGDLKILLPADQPELALEQLAKWHVEHDLFARALSQIDLRVKGMAYLRALPEGEIAPEGSERLLTAAVSEAI